MELDLNNFDNLEGISIPEEAIILDCPNGLTSTQLALKALNFAFKERFIKIKINEKNLYKNKNIDINGFSICLLETGFFSDEIKIDLLKQLKINKKPQLFLASRIDYENNVVLFEGVLKAEKVNEILKNNGVVNNLTLPLNNFEGGIDRLIDNVTLLKTKNIKSLVINNSNFKLEKKKKYKANNFLLYSVIGLGTFLLGQQKYQSNFVNSFAQLPTSKGSYLSNIAITRDLNENSKSICLLAPNFYKTSKGDEYESMIYFNKPLIYSVNPLNEVKITNNNVEIWSLKAESDKRITGPINWPINKINSNDKIKIGFRAKGEIPGKYIEINLITSRDKELIDFDALTKTLGNSKLKWRRAILKNLKNDPNLSISLLFSDKIPSSNLVEKTRKKIIDNFYC